MGDIPRGEAGICKTGDLWRRLSGGGPCRAPWEPDTLPPAPSPRALSAGLGPRAGSVLTAPRPLAPGDEGAEG